jgi:hypothetical protein
MEIKKESKRITKRVGKAYPDVFKGSEVEMQVTVVEASDVQKE